jgi:hypothetical protein
MDQDALLRLQGAWESPEHKDECVVCMNYFERDYWMGTEVGQLEGLSLVVWASRSNFWRRLSCKDGTMGSVNSRGRGRQMCTSRQRRGRHEFEQARAGGSCVSVTVSSSQ